MNDITLTRTLLPEITRRSMRGARSSTILGSSCRRLIILLLKNKIYSILCLIEESRRLITSSITFDSFPLTVFTFGRTCNGKHSRRTIHVLNGVSHDGIEVDAIAYGKVALAATPLPPKESLEKLTS